MAQSYLQVQKKIEQLQKQAEALRDSEIKGVVDRIKIAIAHYGLTAAHLGLELGRSGTRTRTGKAAGKSAPFGDGTGNVWSGRGPRPHWLRDALQAGRSIEEFRLGAAVSARSATSTSASSGTKPANATKGPRKLKRAPSKVNYSDDAGHSWTGRGPKPRWLKEAIESGKSLADFAK
jgi:DNA-binding protein H-NS